MDVQVKSYCVVCHDNNTEVLVKVKDDTMCKPCALEYGYQPPESSLTAEPSTDKQAASSGSGTDKASQPRRSRGRPRKSG